MSKNARRYQHSSNEGEAMKGRNNTPNTRKVKEEPSTAKGYVVTPVSAKNEIQKQFLKALVDKQVVVFSAPAGVGKSYLTMCEVSDWLRKDFYDKVILTRPSVGMGNTIGLLPGSLREKYEPYLLPLIDVFTKRYGHSYYEACLHDKKVEFSPFEYARGRNFDCVVILDEAQNSKPDEMYTILTRVAEGGKLIILGDPNQTDIKGENGIVWLKRFIEDNPELEEAIAIVEGTSDSIVRSGLCKMIVKAKESK